MRLFRDATLLVLVLGGAVAGSQVPLFVQQYEQRLGGALHEARLELGKNERLARDEGLSVDDFARRLGRSADPSVAQLGRNVAQQAERTVALGEQAELLAAAAPLVKPLVLARRHDADLVAETWEMYRYTLTLDPSFAIAGALAGLVVNAGVWGAFGWIGRVARVRPG